MNENIDIEEIKVDPLDYIMGRLWDSGKFYNRASANGPEIVPMIAFDDLRMELSKILCFDSLEGTDNG